jgi:hypothetical protein
MASLRKLLAEITFVTAALLVTSPSFAQNDAGSQSPTNGSSSAAPKESDSALGDAAPQARITRIGGEWRASQLVGATVYSEKGLVIGTVDDLLMASDGSIKSAVLSVGGILGIGNKLVKVSFDKLKLVPSKNNPAHAGAGSTVATPRNAPEVTKSTMKPGGTPGASAATPAQNFDYGLVYPGATKGSLRSAPDYSFNAS